MWVPGSLAYTVAILVFFYRWLGHEPENRAAVAGGLGPDRRSMSLVVASHFLAGSLLTLLLPVGALIAVGRLLGVAAAAPLPRRASGKVE